MDIHMQWLSVSFFISLPIRKRLLTRCIVEKALRSRQCELAERGKPLLACKSWEMRYEGLYLWPTVVISLALRVNNSACTGSIAADSIQV